MDILSQLLSDKCKQIKEDRGWKSNSRIIGEAVEECVITMSCPICNVKELVKCKTNEKSKDLVCKKCSSQFQIKSKKYTKKQNSHLELLGAEYKTTCSSINENNVHYLVIMYSFIGDKYTINNIYFIDQTDINESCIIPRKPLSSNAKRAGWQGCKLVFNKFKSIKLE